MDFDVNVRLLILKPVAEVFGAVADPARMSQYFISSASAPLTAPGRVIWEFADVGAKVAIDVLEVEPDRKIVWESTALGPRTRTTLLFEPESDRATAVTAIEGKFPLTPGGVKLALGQSAGWTNMLCSLKAYVQFGINLRAGLDRRITDTSRAQ